MRGLEAKAFGDNSTARTEAPDEDDEFRMDVEADLGEATANGVVVGDILSSADVDSDVITGTKPEAVCPLALESDTALFRDLLLAEDRTDAKAEELVFCCDRIMFCGAGGAAAAGVDGGASSEARDNVGD